MVTAVVDPPPDLTTVPAVVHRAIAEIVRVTGVPSGSILGRRQIPDGRVHARHLLFAVLIDLDLPAKTVGRLLGRDRKTVTYGAQRADPAIASRIRSALDAAP